MKKSGSMVLRSGQYYLNDKPFFLYSGEIHYFRTPSEKWSTYLKMARKAGLNTVATYIPWRWHEYEEGKFDFTGRTIKERNLLGFLKKCEEEGLFVVLRAGPMCHAEIIDDGLPAWLLDNYPEIGLKKTDGSLFRGAMISFLHPAYLQFVKKWYEKIIPLIAARQITAGGKVISVQLDNEISMINWLTKVPDTSKAAMSLYHSFLRKKYGSIQELNAAFGSRYKNFSQVYSIARKLDNSYLEHFITQLRTSSGGGVFHKEGSPLKVVRAVKKNSCVGVMMDQNGGIGGLFPRAAELL